jgi:HEAT repeat protein
MRRTLLLAATAFVLTSAPSSGQAPSFLNRRMADWIKDLEKGSKPASRRSAAFALGRMGALASFVVPDLARCVRNDSDAGVRDMAAAALGDIVLAMNRDATRDDRPKLQWDEAGKTLEDALEHSDPRVRRSAAYALGAFGSLAESALPALKKTLGDSHPSVRQNAAWAVGRIAANIDTATLLELCDLLRDKNALVRRDVAAALESLGKTVKPATLKVTGKPLLDLVKSDSDEVVRKTALGALAALSSKELAGHGPDLYPLLDSKDPDTARKAAYVLAKMGGEPARRAVPALRLAMADPDPGVQELAAAALSAIGRAAAPAVDDLARAITLSGTPVVRRNCAIALGHIGKEAKSAVPALAEALKPVSDAPTDLGRSRPYEEVREQAAEALAKIEFPHNEAAVPAMREAIRKDTNQLVRQRCVYALFEVRGATDLERHDLIKVLENVLEETADGTAKLVRYDTARLFAHRANDKAPDKTCDVLLAMIEDPDLKVFNGTDANIKATPDEARGGASGTAVNTGGDARYMAAQAMGRLGDKGKNNRAIGAALRKALTDPEPTLRKEAGEALKRLGLDK